MKVKVLTNVSIYDFNSLRKNCYIKFNSQIEEIGDMKNFNDEDIDEIYNLKGSLVMPGLTNCHTHIYSTLSRGMNVPFNPKSFQDILNQLWWKLDAKLDNEGNYYSALVYGVDCIKNGVTSIIDHHASGLDILGSLSEIKKAISDEMGLRGIFCFETSDRFNTYECIKENIEFSRKKDEKFAGLFGMHASLSLSDETLENISKELNGLPIHIHVAESQEDVENCRSKYNMSIIERLDKFNLLKEDSILAHCVHINCEEGKIIGHRNCKIAMNPTSNMNNAVGIANYEIFKGNNIKCMVGNDGLGANITRDYLNVVYAMKNKLGSTTKFGLDDLVELIQNGYEYIGDMLNIKIGKIEEGYKADFITVPYDAPTALNNDNVLGHVFFGIFESFHPKDVWVDGKMLMENYQVKYNTEDLYEKSRKVSEKLWERVNE